MKRWFVIICRVTWHKTYDAVIVIISVTVAGLSECPGWQSVNWWGEKKIWNGIYIWNRGWQSVPSKVVQRSNLVVLTILASKSDSRYDDQWLIEKLSSFCSDSMCEFLLDYFQIEALVYEFGQNHEFFEFRIIIHSQESQAKMFAENLRPAETMVVINIFFLSWCQTVKLLLWTTIFGTLCSTPVSYVDFISNLFSSYQFTLYHPGHSL